MKNVAPTRLGVGLVVACLTLGQSAVADAQPANDPVMAETLFNRAKDLLRAGNWPAACASFQASMDLDPSVSTLFKIAKCHEHEGKLALASYEYQRALELNRDKPQTDLRRKQLDDFGRAAVEQLEPRVPRLRIVMASRPPGLKLFRNGQELALAVIGEPFPVDPGNLEISAEAPGYLSERRALTLKEGARSEVELSLVRVSVPNAPPGPTASRSGVVRTNAVGDEPTAPPGRSQRVGGIALGGLGIVSLGLAGGFGLQTLSKVRDSDPYCNANGECTDPGVRLRDDASTTQALGFVFLGVGVAAVTAGVVLYATAPTTARSGSVTSPGVAFALRPGGALLEGVW